MAKYSEDLINHALNHHLPISMDIETIFARHSVCIGIRCGQYSIVLPLLQETATGYIPLDWEVRRTVAEICRNILRDPRLTVIGHNFHYDLQYFFREFGIFPKCKLEDTMVMLHVLCPEARKSLAHGSCRHNDHYTNWKKDAKDWSKKRGGFSVLCDYNSDDLRETESLFWNLTDVLQKENLMHVYRHRMESYLPTFKMTITGSRMDTIKRNHLLAELESKQKEASEWCQAAIPGISIGSPKQLMTCLYKTLGIKERLHPKKKNVTVDDDALSDIAEKEPQIRPYIRRVQFYRTMQTIVGHVRSPLWAFGPRFMPNFNMCGTNTFRLSSNSNAFDEGTNGQNITKGNEKPKKWYEWVPNCRSLLIPDPGFELFEGDLSRADAYVFAWETEDKDFKAIYKLGVDTHCAFAAEIFGIKGIPLEELLESHPNYLEHRAKIGEDKRFKMKGGGHGTNYGAKAPTIARTLGVTVREAESFQRNYLGRFPGIKKYQQRIENELSSKRFITNKFGYKYTWLRNIDHHAISAALAWKPQSTVGIVTQTIMARYSNLRGILNLSQIHDAVLFQSQGLTKIATLREAGRVLIPYDDPLIIPFDIQHKKNWGTSCKIPDCLICGEIKDA
jgi:DNA polymerase-1